MLDPKGDMGNLPLTLPLAVDTSFPREARLELALKLNALAASPTFAAWGTGQSLDPGTLLRTPEGKPRAAIVYLAHLSDEQRQLAVTLVLSGS